MNPPQDLQELEGYLLRGIRTVEPRATRCLEGTRTSLLANITTEIDKRNGSNVIWIRGAPGSGKSSLSLTAKSLLQRQRQLVTYFRFDRNEAAATTLTALWRRVAYGLARRLPSLREQLLEQLREEEVDLDSALDIFTFLIKDPLSNLNSAIDRPVVIIIDALDECGGLEGHSSPDREMLLQTLRQWAKLPNHFKLLVTSRLEGDIIRALASISTPIDIHSGNILNENPQAMASIEVENDIRTFITNRLQRIREPSSSLSPDWPGQYMVNKMVHRAAGNFMWVTTATHFIFSGIHPQERLDTVMGDVPESVGMQPLYLLYSTILDTSFGNIESGSPEAEVLRAVLGVTIFAQRPFDDVEYTKLPATAPVTMTAVEMIRDRLRSVIDQNHGLQFVHKSFDDFLLSKECPLKYAIRQEESQYLLANLCLTTMVKELHFNICNLETSCLMNKDVPNIQTKVANHIPSLLIYSCCFSAHHLSLTPFDEDLMGQVKEMIMDKLLYWFEAMSLLGEMNRVSHSLLTIVKWLHLSPDDEFKDFVYDAYRFIGAFGHPIAESAPHIYLSALPFAPEYSVVAKHFLPRFPQTITLSTGKPTNWSSCLFTSESHGDIVVSVAFSPDEKHFVSGSDDKTVGVHDSETGNLVSGPFRGDHSVSCVLFNPDGKRVWASYGTGEVICWDIATGDKCLVFRAPNDSGAAGTEGLPILGFTVCRSNGDQKIVSVGETKVALSSMETGSCEYQLGHDHTHTSDRVSISPNGHYITCAAKDDRIISIWKIVDGSEIQGPSHSHPQYKHTESVSALSFSVDGNFVVSGSYGGDILIWDAMTGNTIGPPLAIGTHTTAVAYSPELDLLVTSCGETYAVMVWSASTREAVFGPLEGHTSNIWSLALSHDGRRALTASSDETVRMWNLGGRGVGPVSWANEGHSSIVWWVAFSPCGKKFASVDMQTIRVWDTDQSPHPLLKYTINTKLRYTRLIFSPDGSHIVAYNDLIDSMFEHGSIGVWDEYTRDLACELDLNDNNYEMTAILRVAFRLSDQHLVTCSSNGVVRISNLQDGVSQTLTKLPHILALSPDGMTVVVRDNNRNPSHYVWSTTIQQPLPLTFADDESLSSTESLRRVAYSPSGQFLATVHLSHEDELDTLRVWGTRTGELIAGPSAFEGRIYALAFTPNDRHIAVSRDFSSSTDLAVFIYDVHAGCVSSGPWGGHSERLWGLAFSPDGEKLVSGSEDHQIRVRNTADLLDDLLPSNHSMGVGTYMSDGWVKNSEGLLFWVPKERRARLVWPGSVLLDGHGITTELQLSNFKYGKNWAECLVQGN